MLKPTPKLPYDMGKIIPSLAGFDEITVRLRPRREEPEPGLRSSKMGGRFLWPADEPWPRCSEPEYEIENEFGGLPVNVRSSEHPEHNDVYVGVLQLRADEFPEVEFPRGKDILQLLWCPRHHESTTVVVCKVFWWRESEIAEAVEPPPPSHPAAELYPRPCRLYPERVTEYPDVSELSKRQVAELEEWRDKEWSDEDALEIYQSVCSVCPGVKVGGYVPWLQDPDVPHCKCGRIMSHLLTVSDHEFDGGNAERWCPVEDREALEGDYKKLLRVQSPHGLSLGSGAIYVFICQQCTDRPIATVFQR